MRLTNTYIIINTENCPAIVVKVETLKRAKHCILCLAFIITIQVFKYIEFQWKPGKGRSEGETLADLNINSLCQISRITGLPLEVILSLTHTGILHHLLFSSSLNTLLKTLPTLDTGISSLNSIINSFNSLG